MLLVGLFQVGFHQSQILAQHGVIAMPHQLAQMFEVNAVA